jgi:AraC-like DNA-binding protein
MPLVHPLPTVFPKGFLDSDHLRSRFLYPLDPTGRITVVFHGQETKREDDYHFANATPPEFHTNQGVLAGCSGLTYVLTGNAHFSIPSDPGWLPIDAGPGTLVWLNHIPNNTLHVQADSKFRECSVSVDLGLARQLSALGMWPSEVERQVVIGDSPALGRAYYDLFKLLDAANASHAEVMIGLLQIFMLADSLQRATQRDSNFVSRACQLLREHPEPAFTTRAAAALLGMENRDFSRRFTRDLGVTPAVWQLRNRMDRASALLPSHNVTEVAKILGYRSAAQFSRQFKKAVGIPPSSMAARMEPVTP